MKQYAMKHQTIQLICGVPDKITGRGVYFSIDLPTKFVQSILITEEERRCKTIKKPERDQEHESRA